MAICDKYSLRNMLRLSITKEFNDLDADYVFFLLCAKESSLNEEDFKVMIAVRWIEADRTNRKNNLMRIADELDLYKVTPGYVWFLLETEPLCMEYLTFIAQLCLGMAKCGQIIASGPPKLRKMAERSAIKLPDSLLLFDKSSKHLQCYQPSKKKMTQLKPYLDGMCCFLLCHLRFQCQNWPFLFFPPPDPMSFSFSNPTRLAGTFSLYGPFLHLLHFAFL